MSQFRYMDRVRARQGEAAAPQIAPGEAARPAFASSPTPERTSAQMPAPIPASSTDPVDASPLARVMGGSPLAVLARLLVLSFIVGAVLAWLDIRPVELLWWARDLVNRLWAFGFEGLREALGYVGVGALIVVPLWALSRLFGSSRA